MFEQLRKLTRENRRFTPVLIAAVLALVLAAWGIWGGFQFQVSKFFASEGPTCGALGGSCCAQNAANAAECSQRGATQNIGVSSDCAFGCFAAPGGGSGGGGGGGTPADPSGACVFKTNFNAPEGAWFCGGLQCQLDGNPSGGQEFPPAGPATSLNVKLLGYSADGTTKLDATPKCANGKECYPPKDPLWTCTGPMTQGRNGSDFYDCYNPIVHRTGPGSITCCANTGLSGDCFTWNEGTAVGATPAPDYPAPVCAP